MSRSKRRSGQTRPLAADIVAKADRMVQRLRTNYELGLQARLDKRSTADFAADHGINENTLRRFRVFATAFSEKQFKQLCALRRPNGLPLQFGHVIYLLIIDDPAGRMNMAKRAARLGWTAPQVNAAIPQSYRAAKGHGRAMQVPSSPQAALQQLRAEAGRWVRRADLVVAVVKEQAQRSLSGPLRVRICETIVEVERLEEAARNARKGLKRLIV